MLGTLHEALVLGRRFDRLVDVLDGLLPAQGSFLDVGAGSGRIAAALSAARPGRTFAGIDTVARSGTAIPVTIYDGRRIPFPDGAFDAALLVDVLHHTHSYDEVLAEVRRVCRRTIYVKDHLCESGLDRRTLSLMDRVGNARFGVSLDCRYLSRREWTALFGRLGLEVRDWRDRLRLYPAPLDLAFGRGLHFAAALEISR